MKEKIKEWTLMFVATSLAVITILLLIQLGTDVYCEIYSDQKYWQDSVCFDIDVRCEIECAVYGENYTGFLENGCMCQCNEGQVNYCSGFYYEK